MRSRSSGAAGERVLTHSRYAVSAREQVDDEVDVRVGPGDLTADLAQAVAVIAPGGRVGVEAAYTSMARGAQATARIGEADPDVHVVPEVGHVERLRLIKDDEEIAAIARAADMVDEALADVLAAGLVGHSEREIAFALQTRLFLENDRQSVLATVDAVGEVLRGPWV